jgi:hypothetical protein
MMELYIYWAPKEQEEEVVDYFMAFSYDTKDTEERYSASQTDSDWDPSKYTLENLLLEIICVLLLYAMVWSSRQNNDEFAWQYS